MIFDALTTFSDAQAITASAASTNSYDLSAARNIGVGSELHIVCHVTTAFTDAGSDSTVTVTIETDDNSAFSSAVARQTIGTFAALSAVGARLRAAVDIFAVREQHFRLQYTVANGNLSTGAITAYLTDNPEAAELYADNKLISGPTN